MRLLLLLSALLAALTGAGAGARPVAVQAVAASARVVAPERVRAHVALAIRPAGVASVEPVSVVRSTPSLTRARLWMQRRRE